MRIDISDARIERRLRDQGMIGRISKIFIDDYRVYIVKTAISRALVDLGAKAGAPITDEQFAAAPRVAAAHIVQEVASW